MTPAATDSLLTRAFSLAEELHAGQKTRDGRRPYLHHPMAVASLVMRYGGDESQAAAALLHDTIGDSRASAGALAARFTPEVARLAHAFADPPIATEKANDWGAVRRAYLAKVAELDRRSLLVVACEELHEMEELLEDLRETPPAEVWSRYPTARHNLGWYFREILTILNRRLVREGTTPQESALVSRFATRLKALLPITFESSGSVPGIDS